MNIYSLGISAFYHDSAAALLKDGIIVAAAQEERFSRVKQDSRFPSAAIRFCIDRAGIDIDDIDGIFYYEDPKQKFGRLMSTYASFGLRACLPFTRDMPNWLVSKLHIGKRIEDELKLHFGVASVPPVKCVAHHESHAASAFFASPFEKAGVLCIDGVGEQATTSAWIGNGATLESLWQVNFPHSLGLLSSAFTYYCGFKVDSGEYKLMGLAPYGVPRFVDKIQDHLIDIKADGSFWLNMDYFDFALGETMINERFEKLFGGPRREPEGEITEREFDLAASVQVVLEEAVVRLARSLRHETGVGRLCMAGGVALNCVSNGRLLKEGLFDDIWVQPASGDSGGALGAAYIGWFTHLHGNRSNATSDVMQGTYLGSEYSNAQVLDELSAAGASYTVLPPEEIAGVVAQAISEGNVVGWFQGRMEFGPRSLGARSILGDARNKDMQSVMNLKIKNRESFRPFAPAVLLEHASDWFDLDVPSPYMLFVVPVAQRKRLIATDHEAEKTGIEKLKVARSVIPAVTHVDYSARVQTVEKRVNPLFHELIERFRQITGCPVIVNTSFNVRGEPIVESPLDAYKCFMRTEMDCLAIGGVFMKKSDQPQWREACDWKEQYALD
jgi:carbamoyltransferase